MKIQAISLWQPHASLCAAKVKHFETRHWYTRYRGPLLICASKRKPTLDEKIYYSREPSASPIRRAYMMLGYDCLDALPYGMAVAIVDLKDCINTNLMSGELRELGGVFGDFSPDRFAWRLENHRRIVNPFPVVGRQGFFTVDVDMNNLKFNGHTATRKSKQLDFSRPTKRRGNLYGEETPDIQFK